MKKYTLFALLFIFSLTGFAQDKPLDVDNMTREEVLDIPYDQLIEMPLDQLLKLADIVGVSLEELYEMILNKDVTSASKQEESSFEAPLSTSVISYDEIIASGARTIEEALRLVPGLIVREKTNGNFDVHIRGNDNIPARNMFVYSENSLSLIMIDGRPVYNYVHGGTFWETLPIGFEDIDRIEIVRGPSSALYGPNAVTGVVNIITKRKSTDGELFSANIQGGMQSSVIGNLGLYKDISEKFGIRLTGNFMTSDRNSELLYVLKANDYLTKDELAVFPDPQYPKFQVFDPADDVDKMYPDPSLARYNYGSNLYLFYDIGKDSKIDISTGLQSSDILSSTMGDNPSPYVGRTSNTYYANVSADVKGLRFQANYLGGWQDIIRQDTGFKVDHKSINLNVEYDINFDKLMVRPGISYQYAWYNDMPYLSYDGQGFLNGEKSISGYAASLRLDYKPIDKLRLIAALRGDIYSTNDNPYLSYQFISSYKLNKKNLLRLVYSRANRGPFLVDSYANYYWDRENRPRPENILFSGDKNMDLLRMDMLELGYRTKPNSKVQIDLEAFHTITNDLGALLPDSINRISLQDTTEVLVHMLYQNIKTKVKQYGVSFSLSYIINKNLITKFYGTYQHTKVENAIESYQDALTQNLIVTLLLEGYNQYSFDDYSYFNTTNDWTPDFFGGFYIDYKMLEEKLHANFNTYYYTSQVFDNKYGEVNIDPKVILNLRVGYKVIEQAEVYLNIRNLLGDKREFAYMDEIGTLVLGGFNVKF